MVYQLQMSGSRGQAREKPIDTRDSCSMPVQTNGAKAKASLLCYFRAALHSYAARQNLVWYQVQGCGNTPGIAGTEHTRAARSD